MLVIIALLCLVLSAFLDPHVIRNDETLTIIETRLGELDINHPDGHRVTIWYQDVNRGINVRLLVLPWSRRGNTRFSDTRQALVD